MTVSNIIFIVWDSARVDAVKEHAPTFNKLAKENLSFSNAIAPSTWSLPSHVSLFTGQYPHEHNVYRVDHFIDDLELGNQLQKQGYVRYGVSGNGFACHRYGFDTIFDEFYYTRQRSPPFEEALQAQKQSFELRNEGLSKPEILTTLFRQALTHKYRSKSLANVGSFLWDRLLDFAEAQGSSLAQDLQVGYSPDRTTQKIIEALDRNSATSKPAFIFANYMDCHRPYDPEPEIRQEYVNDRVSRSDLDRLDSEVARPWRFVERLDQGEAIPENDIKLLRELYKAEVRTVDQHLQVILDNLDSRGLREETMVVLTADHGENLGEKDEFGRRRMGHEGSISDNLTHVPLLVAHPELSAEAIDGPVSLRRLFNLFDADLLEDLSTERIVERMQPVEDDVVLCEYPVVGGENVKDRYPGVSEESFADRLLNHTVAAYSSDWKVVVDSAGQRRAWNRGDETSIADAPDNVIKQAEVAVERLCENENANEDISDEKVADLEALGYM